ncbi:glycoside hydrolase family 36 protein [Croceitalea rosinachiae]|uniref:Alpha-galactosidase n=1 Tax=Croceitalea rosinachiae TaxID=3075596 RepID=A0ABU3A7T2_9FLAO|nr:alpha-galactosidase [Croceitalea sp. F388]MDT0605627.1 alpha-galactosidase [Croceitalea sp. F388]
MEANNNAIDTVIKDSIRDIKITSNTNDASCQLEKIGGDKELMLYRFHIVSDNEFIPRPIVLEWKVPALNCKGLWKPTSDFSKRIEADWELENHESRISIDSPVNLMFGNNDENIICFSCSNAINKIELAAKYCEEDDHIHCKIIFFTECKYTIKDFGVDIRLDYRNIHFSKVLKETSEWWESYDDLKPTYVPDIARKPLYSTWYQFHQDLEEDLLIYECKLAKSLGFESIIIDDGWQTKDNNRGYDYTGDWQSEHFEDFKTLIKKIQNLGMNVGLWYSVPFCGTKSKAYQLFKGKFLTENHRWAPVFDPRFKVVREYLVGLYVKAAMEWGLDGFKLDFIDDFKAYPDTSFEIDPERDFNSINSAVDALLTEVIVEVKKVNPEIFIEFRQKYTGPAMRKYGNMMRAFDCPGDATMNRVRIADLKMLSGKTAVHSDMVTWNLKEKVEYAAFQYLNTMFGVPQISVMLNELPKSHLNMIRFYTRYWLDNTKTLLDGEFIPSSPLANYPVKKVTQNDKVIFGLFDDQVIKVDKVCNGIDIINAKPSEEVLVLAERNIGKYTVQTFNCQGYIVNDKTIFLKEGVNMVKTPISGLIQMKLVSSFKAN